MDKKTLIGNIKGPPGNSPWIGGNGNWWVGETDTGVSATVDMGVVETAAGAVEKVNKLINNSVIVDVSGEVLSASDSSDMELVDLKLFGKTTQDGTPSPDAPVPLVSVGDTGSVGVTVCGKNLANDSVLPTIGATWDETEKAWYLEIYSDNKPVLWKNNSGYLGQITLSYTAKYGGDDPGMGGLFVIEYTDGTHDRKESTTTPQGVYEKYTITSAKGKTVRMVRYGYFWPRPTWFKEIQVELGDTATPYEPYTAQSLAVATPNGLPGIPVESGGNYTDANGQQWVCDEVDFARGVYVQRVQTKTLTDEDDWVKNVETYHTHRFGDYGSVVNGAQMSPQLPGAYITSATEETGIYVTNSSTTGRAHINIRTEETKNMTVGGFKEWLAEHPIDVCYASTTRIETPLSEEELAAFKALHTNRPNTKVYSDGGAGMEMEYIADTKIYIDNKFTELQNAILSGGANV